MAANKFAAMLHGNTHRMAFILVYAVLEWILIALLLVNGLFSYLITKFASFFGLKPPCLFCSRIDHLFEPEEGRLGYRDLLCDAHAEEVSSLGCCSHHRRLAEATVMCEGFSPSMPERSGTEAEEDLRCSCCKVGMESELYSPFFFLDPSWGVLEYAQDAHFVEQVADEGKMVCLDGDEEIAGGELEQEGKTLIELSEDYSSGVSGSQSDRMVDEERLVPLEVINVMTMMKKNLVSSKLCGADDREMDHNCAENEISDFDIGGIVEGKMMLDSPTEWTDTAKENSSATLLVTPMNLEENSLTERADAQEHSLVLMAGMTNILVCSSDHESAISLPASLSPGGGVDVVVEASATEEEFVRTRAFKKDSKFTEMDEPVDQNHVEEPIHLSLGIDYLLPEINKETTDNDQVAAAETEPVVNILKSLDHLSSECHEIEEQRAPETPTYIEGIHGLHKRFQFERKETWIESLDESVASDIEGNEPLTVDHLKSALRAERKALNTLYCELEEERNASAIAANQTMAMITRLQEERAAMQMEALQYQRMMEEQSEYDQEALHLLNEMMVKREKEKQVLEKELEVYRQKILLYEAKERRRMALHMANGMKRMSSVSSSATDSDDLSFDYCEPDDSAFRINPSNENSSSDVILSSGTDYETAKHLITLDESFADFEQERLFILEQLKVLEGRLFTWEDEDLGNINSHSDHTSEENHHDLNEDYEILADTLHGSMNGYPYNLDNNHNLHYNGMDANCRGNKLLPLFDAISEEKQFEQSMKQGTAEDHNSPKSVSRLVKEQEKIAFTENVDNFYGRLQALEADSEFLKHCIKSLTEGDEGVYLLRKILQHLRELRIMELRAKNAGNVLA
ncbi:myosin-binding protein 3-like isoform X2 [Typha angustifolia]|uniref:myosin-binding protein 3-like isoform X2 n=1 Tax=Typha angustifolia TaxID=59011 RepID=UPI003C2D8CB4